MNYITNYEGCSGCAFENAKSGHLVIDRAKSKLDNVGFGIGLKNKIDTELEQLRRIYS